MKEARIWRKGNSVVSKTPYNEEFINFAREQKAKWNSSEKTWTFTDLDLESVKAKMKKYFEVVVGKIQLHDEGNFAILREEKHEWQELSKELQNYLLERAKPREKNGKLVISFGMSIGLKINATKTENGFTIDDTAIVNE